jgi:hypothetical protein
LNFNFTRMLSYNNIFRLDIENIENIYVS